MGQSYLQNISQDLQTRFEEMMIWPDSGFCHLLKGTSSIGIEPNRSKRWLSDVSGRFYDQDTSA